MRFLCLLLLLALLVVIGGLAFINSEAVSLHYFDKTLAQQSYSLPLSLVIVSAYVLGMLSGWSVLGFLRRNVERVTERHT
jgi:uncharacterized integral membrane protein